MPLPIPPLLPPLGPLDTAPLRPAEPHDRPLDLREIDLRDGQFAGADLTDADQGHACLAGADLSGARLRGARLGRADLTLADLRGADLTNADLSGADLAGADLREARMDGADLAGAELGWARIDGALGLDPALLSRPRANGRIRGEALEHDPGEPAEGLRAFRRGERAHAAGDIGVAERHFATALGWVPDSDAAWYALGALALEREDLERAEAFWGAALATHPGADRARIDLAALALWRGDHERATRLLQPLLQREDASTWVEPALRALAAGAADAAAGSLRNRVGDSPGLRWYTAHAATESPPAPPQPTPAPGHDTVSRLGDEAWVEAERGDLETVLRDRAQPAWVWHGAIARAVSIGALDLAWRAEQHLGRIAPEHRLWSLQLKHLDVTAQAFDALVRTRRGRLGRLESVRWVALGAHGPTARLQCEGGVFFAKRYTGLLRPSGSLAFTHRVCRRLADAGLQVPVALADRDGDDAMAFGDDLLALYPDMAGTSIRDEDIDPATSQQIGSLLARIHVEGATLAAGSGRPRGGVRVGTRVLRHRNPAGVWHATLGQDAACAAQFDQHPLAARMMSLLEATGRRLQSVVAGCPHGLVHGDFAAGNVLHTKEDPGRFAVVDWDLCDLDLLVWDLARTTDLLAVRWSDESGRPVEVRRNILQALVRGYHAVRPLLRAEQAALPVLIAASRVDLDASMLPICARLEPDLAAPVLDRELARLSRAAAGAPELATLVAEALHSG